MQLSFHNSISLQEEELTAADENAKSQEEEILSIFKQFNGVGLTPFMVQDILEQKGKSWPITSIRRAISNLSNRKLLIKSLEANAKGIYRVKNHRWTLA